MPKRDELSLRTVLAFPNDSSNGLHSTTWQQEIYMYGRALNGSERLCAEKRTLAERYASAAV